MEEGAATNHGGAACWPAYEAATPRTAGRSFAVAAAAAAAESLYGRTKPPSAADIAGATPDITANVSAGGGGAPPSAAVTDHTLSPQFPSRFLNPHLTISTGKFN